MVGKDQQHEMIDRVRQLRKVMVRRLAVSDNGAKWLMEPSGGNRNSRQLIACGSRERLWLLHGPALRLSLPVFGEGGVRVLSPCSLRSRTAPDLAIARPPSPKPGRELAPTPARSRRAARRARRGCRRRTGRRVPVDRHLGHRFADSSRSGGARRRRLRSPASSAKKRRDHTTGLPRLPSMVGTTTSAPLLRVERRDQPVDQRGVDLRHVAEADDGAVGLRRHRRDAGLAARSRGRRRNRGLCTKVTGRPASAASTRSRWWPVTTMTGCAREASACSTAMRTSGLPPISASSLLGPPMRVERPAASTIAATRWPGFSAIGARLRPRDDLHQQAADAHAGDVAARDRQAGTAAASGPSRSRSPWASARSPARRAPGGRAPRRPACRLPGSTGMPKCSIVPPTASTAAGMTSRRSAIAEAPNTMTSSAPCVAAPRRARSASAAVSCGTRRSATIVAPAGASRSAVTRSVFSITLSARPGSMVEITPTLRTAIGRDAHQRLRRRARPRAPRRARPRRPRTE